MIRVTIYILASLSFIIVGIALYASILFFGGDKLVVSFDDIEVSGNIENYVFEFKKDILELIYSSDLAITRSGASTTDELVYTRTPFITVPLPNSIDNHQYLNAKFYTDKGYCLMLEQDNFSVKNLFDVVVDLIRNKSKLLNIRENMKNNKIHDVYSVIESQINHLI